MIKVKDPNQLDMIDEKVVDRYLTQDGLGCFSRVKPSESKKTLAQVSKDVFDLVQQFKAIAEVAAMYSYKVCLCGFGVNSVNIVSRFQPL